MGLELNDGPRPKLPRGKAAPQEPTFSQQVLAAANHVEYVDWKVGAMNRRIGMRAPRGGDAMRLGRILSAEDSGKPAVFNQAMLAFCITEIDGDPVPRPGTELQIEALLDRIGFEGIVAAGRAFARMGAGDEAQDAKN